MYEVEFTAEAEADLDRLSQSVAQRILKTRNHITTKKFSRQAKPGVKGNKRVPIEIH
jgi:mRNA-degrading endonuclease RelE of RelBE toxin-antitoxin system